MIKDMVVSAYMEDVSWVSKALETDEIHRVHIYNKGSKTIGLIDDRITVRRAENVGREGETFLRHIIENYDSLPGGLWFVQGNPFDHSPDLIGLVRNASQYQHLPFKSMSCKYNNHIPPIRMVDINNAFWVLGMRCSEYFISEGSVVGHCAHEDGPAVGFYDRFAEKYRTRDAFGYLSCRLGIARPGPITVHAFGACFFVSGACIRRHPKWVYEEMRRFLLESHSQGSFQGYILERFWAYLLTGVSYDSLADCYRGILTGSVAVWCSRRRKIWIKKGSWINVAQNPDTVTIYYEGGVARRLAGLDVIGRDETSLECPSLNMAEDIFLSGVHSEGRWGGYLA